MPKQVYEIKEFIELCRRKDASCTYTYGFLGREGRRRKSGEEGENWRAEGKGRGSRKHL